MVFEGLDLIPILGSSGLAAVNVYLLFRVLTILNDVAKTLAGLLEYLRPHNFPE